MNTGRKVSLKFNLLWITTVLISCITSFASANYTSPALFYNTLTAQQVPSDTLPLADTLPQNDTDTGANKIHKIDTINIKISKDSLELLMRYHWPGNIRELRNVVEHAVIVSNGETLQVRLDKQPHPASTELLRLDQLESKHILEILEKTQWQIKGPNGAAHILGLNPSTLYSKMKKLGIHSSGKSRESRQKRTLAASESTQNEKRRSSNLET